MNHMALNVLHLDGEWSHFFPGDEPHHMKWWRVEPSRGVLVIRQNSGRIEIPLVGIRYIQVDTGS